MLTALLFTLLTAAAAQAPVERALEWTLAHEKELPKPMTVIFSRRLIRTAADVNRLAGLKGLAHEPAELDDPLYQKACGAKADSAPLKRLQEHLDEHEGELLSADVPVSTRLMTAAYLEGAGVRLKRPLAAVVEELRKPLRAKTALSDDDLNIVTHIIFSASGDFDHYVDSASFQWETQALRQANSRFLGTTLSDAVIDLSAEVLLALKLLKVPEDAETARMKERLKAAQEPDGGWGVVTLANAAPQKFHYVFTAQMALLDFAPTFRGANPYCDALW